ncbi:hypothetical protein BJ085DRAFT_24127 [Dimargaris cristalligena]|uniref:Transmembrane 9 superfamily member n=1 Tax=Dimargaris cristalligena TaxID=215637 RepID=A0A4P9ZZS1_9FUNG|nr:hypothetical protein BJ085DRAFT_24127 [Dimargaris cristalligena]|eukprot:RKP39245.1 hypothetical protein BJ085DRAFT_24127 [Dimargaris cristalligena]
MFFTLNRAVTALLGLTVLATPAIQAFYVPSVGPQYVEPGQKVPLFVNKVTSDRTPLPYAYYDLDFVCKPATPEHVWLNLGEVLRGDRIMSSEYQLTMGQNQTCQVLCSRTVTSEQAEQAKQLIQKDYRAEWIVDNLPGATTFRAVDTGAKSYEPGFPLGFYNKFTDVAYIHNHVTIQVLYETVQRRLIVGFEVYPLSIYNNQGGCPDLSQTNPSRQPIGSADNSDTKLTYTYSVVWKEEPTVRWRNRWDRYLSAGHSSVHWYSIINSVFVNILLSGIIAIIMLRVLNRDLSMYNDEDLREDQLETIGWKLLHGDVFRPPKFGGLLAPLLGSGVQLLLVAVTVTVLAAMGVLSPSYRGGMVSVGALAYVAMSVFGGYWSARVYKVWRGTAWVKNALMTGMMVPGLCITLFSGLNLFIWAYHSSSALPFGTFVAIAVLWIGLSVPLTVAGAFLGSRKAEIQHPVRTNQIPRQIPPQPWYLKSPVAIFITGACPFGVIFVEVYFMLKSIWQDKYYYMFGFMVLVGAILIITVIEITIVMIYFQLCSENHRWWWRSYLFGGSSAFFIFLYSVHYFFTRLNVSQFVPGLVFMVDSLLASCAYFLCFGSVAFFATYYFLRKIFAAVKLD